MSKLNLLLMIFLLSCSQARIRASDQKKWWDELGVKQVNLEQGMVTLMELPYREYAQLELFCRGKKQPFYVEGQVLKAYLSESYFSQFKPFHCTYKSQWGKKQVAVVKTLPHRFKEENLKVDKKRVFLSKKDLARVLVEQKELNKVYADLLERPLFDRAFSVPLNSYITSTYGTRRLYNKKKKGQHLGTDYRAKVGVPIPAANKGQVVLAKNLFYSGNTVIINHGLGIFTVYGHLSQIKAEVGDVVPPGEIIGLSGATGRVSGPHLHWGVKVAGNWVDGHSLVEAGF